MSISDALKNQLNKMNRAAQNVGLGTLVQTMQSGSQTQLTQIAGIKADLGSSGATTSAGSEVNIPTGLTAIVGKTVSITRSGSSLYNLQPYVASGSGTAVLKVSGATGGSALASGDVVTWFVF